MAVKLTYFWIAFVFVSIFRGALSIKKGYYTIVAPATVRPDSVFHVSLTLNDFHKSCWFNISLTTNPEGKQIYELEGIEVKPGTTKLVELHAPPFNSPDYAHLEIFGYRGIISKDSTIIFFEVDQFWTFVQTDKAKYKPGEVVQFRIICIDQLTRPAKLNREITVEIYDEDNNRITTILDVKFVQGVFRSEFQLSEYPILGTWTIRVVSGYTNLAVKNFEVDRHVLPKFNVVIYTKKVSIHDERMLLEIIASYFHGQPVKGNVTVDVINTYAPNAKSLPTLRSDFQINGRIVIGLSLKKDLKLDNSSRSLYPSYVYSIPTDEIYKFAIEVIVTDALREEQSWTTIKVGVYEERYKVELQSPRVFEPDPLLTVKVKVTITDLDDNSIQDTESPIEIIVGCHKKIHDDNYGDFDIARIEYKPEIGKDFAMIQVTNKNNTECFLYAEYQGSQSHTQWMKEKVISFNIDILTESPQEGRELEVKITYKDPIEEFSYEIVSRKDIIQSGHVNVPGNETTYILRLNVTFLMVPKITIYVHLIKNMDFIGQFKDVLIRKALLNSIEITTDNETEPGSSVYINVTTDEGSYVGLMGLDRSALQSLQKRDIWNENYVTQQLGSANSIIFYYNTAFYGRIGDIITFSNVFPPNVGVAGGGGFGGGGYVPPRRVRTLFPESWLFKDFERTPAGGFNIFETTPDSITTWAITGFSIHPETGLTFTKNTTNLKVFQEFFITMDFPSLVREGEIIVVPVYVSNFMNQEALTNVTIESHNEGLVFLDHPEASSLKSTKDISAPILAKKLLKTQFFLKPLKPGQYNVTVQAVTSVASDAIQKTLTVKSQGIPYAMSKTYLVHLAEKDTQEDEITIDIPANAVPGSQRVEISVAGDIFQPLMRYIQKLAQTPYGNCEENMKLIATNSMVLKYLKVLNYSNPSLESKLKRNIDLGYQNQLSFKYLDGSFGLFSRETQRTGGIWPTIFSLWGLKQANEFIDIDPKVINRGLDYLKSKQKRNGCFRSESSIEEDVKLTAFGLMVFLMDEHSNTTYHEVVSKGLDYLNEITDDLEYSPISVMATYALFLGKYEMAGDYLKKLTSHSRFTSKQMVWTKSDTLQSHLEAIAGSLVNLFESQEIPEQIILHIVRGLIFSKVDEPSITHMIALQAMIAFVEKLFLSKTNLDITFKDDQNKSGNFQINPDNSQVEQRFEISQSSRKIHLQSKGHGFAVVDVRYNYNLVPENQSSAFYTTSISTKNTTKHLGVLKICASVPSNNTKNKLTTMEVYLQSDFIFTEKDSRKVENLSENIKSVQVNGSRDRVVVYFELIASEVCIELEVRKTYSVMNSKPGWVIVYGAHDKDQKATKSFMFNEF